MLLPSIDIMNRKPKKAWELYLKMDNTAESFTVLQLLANDCYRVSIWKTSTHLDLHMIHVVLQLMDAPCTEPVICMYSFSALVKPCSQHCLGLSIASKCFYYSYV